MNTPEQRMKSLLHFFGYQGGTIHQLSKETGVDSSDLLYSEAKSTGLYSDNAQGWFCHRTCDKDYRVNLAKQDYIGNCDFWLGVADSYWQGE